MNLLSFRKDVLGFVCLAITSVILLSGLWPFNFSPENKVRWLQDQNGIEFYGPGLIYSNIPLFQSSTISAKSFSIELCLQSNTEEISHIGHIFSIFDEHGSEFFFVGQWKSHLLLGKGIHGKKNYREIGVREAMKKGNKRWVTITSGADGTHIYIDGILMKSNPKFYLFSVDEKPLGRILLGNSPSGKEYWTGNLLSLAIYNRIRTGEEVLRHLLQQSHDNERASEEGLVSLYLFNEHLGTLAHDALGTHHLVIPLRFQPLKKTILILPWEDFRFTRSYLMDILTNIFGFIPFGFFLSAFLQRRKRRSTLRLFLSSMILAGGLSLFIELSQVYLPTRSSQFMDVITNLLGTAIGVVLFFKSPLNRGA